MNGGNKRNKSSHKNNNAGIIYVATKRLRRGEKDTMDAIIEAYQNITVPQYVRNVGRLHRRWKSGHQTAKKELSHGKSRTTDGRSAGSK